MALAKYTSHPSDIEEGQTVFISTNDKTRRAYFVRSIIEQKGDWFTFIGYRVNITDGIPQYHTEQQHSFHNNCILYNVWRHSDG